MQNKVKSLRLTSEFNFMSQEELAKKIGVSRQTILNIEKGGFPSLKVAKDLADFFGRTVEDIFFTQSVAHSDHEGGKVRQ